MPLKIRRGLEEDRLSITPALAEPIYTTDTKELFFGDGETVGGNSLFLIREFSVSNVASPDPGTSTTVLHEISTDNYTSVKYMVQVTCNDERQLSEMLVVHNGTTAYLTEYGVVVSREDGTRLSGFDVILEDGSVKLLGIPLQGALTNFQTHAQALRT